MTLFRPGVQPTFVTAVKSDGGDGGGPHREDDAGYRRRRLVKTTQPDPASQKVPDLLKRDFTAEQPNTAYVGDITYLPLATGANLYL